MLPTAVNTFYIESSSMNSKRLKKKDWISIFKLFVCFCNTVKLKFVSEKLKKCLENSKSILIQSIVIIKFITYNF